MVVSGPGVLGCSWLLLSAPGCSWLLPLGPISEPIWPQLGPILASKIGPPGVQEPSKMHSNLHLISDTVLDRFLVDFGSNLAPQTTPKAIQKSIQKLPNKLTTKSQKFYKNIIIYSLFVPSAFLTWIAKP